MIFWDWLFGRSNDTVMLESENKELRYTVIEHKEVIGQKNNHIAELEVEVRKLNEMVARRDIAITDNNRTNQQLLLQLEAVRGELEDLKVVDTIKRMDI